MSLLKKIEQIENFSPYQRGEQLFKEDQYSGAERYRLIIAYVNGYRRGKDARILLAAVEMYKILKESIKNCSCTIDERLSGHLIECETKEASDILEEIDKLFEDEVKDVK